MFHALTAVMIGSAFIIPSTSGRAAMMLPIFTAIAANMQSRIRVAFALLIPTVILLSAFGSLVGAGAHIAAVELLTRMADQSVSFAYWTYIPQIAEAIRPNFRRPAVRCHRSRLR
jgi:hypothetical protein